MNFSSLLLYPAGRRHSDVREPSAMEVVTPEEYANGEITDAAKLGRIRETYSHSLAASRPLIVRPALSC